MEDPDMVEQMFADLVYSSSSADQPPQSPPSPKSPVSEENYPVSPKSLSENGSHIDAILDEVLSMHDSLSTPPSPKSTFSDDQITSNEAENKFVPDIEPTLRNVYEDIPEPNNQPIIYQEEPQPQQGTIKAVMTQNGEYFNVVVIPSNQLPENYQFGNVCFTPQAMSCDTKIEHQSPPPSVGPPTPPSAAPEPTTPERSPVAQESLARKRGQNKRSSKKYRQKIKNKEQALFDAVGDLNKKKRELELELASTKAVNKFLVDSLKQKFGFM
jgi:hypothetical protein